MIPERPWAAAVAAPVLETKCGFLIPEWVNLGGSGGFTAICAVRKGGAIVDAIAIYWHFIAGLWLYLLALLSLNM